MQDRDGDAPQGDRGATAVEERVRATFSAARAPVVMIGLDGRIVLANRPYCVLMGYDEASLRKLEAFALIHPDDREDLVTQLREIYAGRLETVGPLLRCQRQDGGYLPLRFRVSPVRGEGDAVTHFVAIAEDRAPLGTAPAGASAAASSAAPRILLVDDDSFIRRYASEMLMRLGYQVTVAATGMEALAALRRGETFDLLFTDIVMPGGINGRELVDAARQLRPGLPVLYTSGYMSSEVVRLARQDPSAQLLEKPYRRIALAEAVKAALATT